MNDLGYKPSNPLVPSVILHQTQQQVKKFNNFKFNLLNGLVYKPGMLTDLIHLSAW